MSNFDLIIRNGTLVDGSGGPPYEGDLAIANGKIVGIGNVTGVSARELDARDKLVTPGFVDIHTHYDGQALWDPHLAPSAWHGVTTAIMGNCGVGFAPCRADDREKLVALMEGVEDIPAPVMHQGLKWNWSSFPEYLDALDERPRDIDVGALLPHAAVRVFVMGDRALDLQNALPSDIEKMRKIATEAVRAGAMGFSTSRTTSHRSLAGDYIPTLRAQEQELTQIALGLADAGSGYMEVVSEWNYPDVLTEFAMLRRIAQTSGRNVLFSCTEHHTKASFWDQLLAQANAAKQAGISMRPVCAPRAIGILLGLESSQNPFSATPTYKSVARLPLKERVAAMRNPDTRAKILSEDPRAGSTFPLFHRLSYSQMYVFGNPPDYEPKPQQSLQVIADQRGCTPQELAYDIMVEGDGTNFIYAPLSNYKSLDLSACEAMLADPISIMGLGDGGAHVGCILDAGFPTWVLSYWGKTRKRFTVQELVRRLTSDTAGAAGLRDRGMLRVGMKADVNIIDYEKIGLGQPYTTHDLPAGGQRLLQKASGYDATIVSGVVTYRHGEATGALPGRLVRGQR